LFNSNSTDQKSKARILARLRSAALGNFGDFESIGEGVSAACLGPKFAKPAIVPSNHISQPAGSP
jgi:hypothetical protein